MPSFSLQISVIYHLPVIYMVYYGDVSVHMSVQYMFLSLLLEAAEM